MSLRNITLTLSLALAACVVLQPICESDVVSAQAAGYDSVIREVEKQLRSKEPSERAEAVEKVAATADKRAIKVVIDKVLTEWHHIYAMQMGRTLRYFKGQEAVEDIEKSIKKFNKGLEHGYRNLYFYTGIAEGKTEHGDKLINESLHQSKSNMIHLKAAVIEAIALAKRDDLAVEIAKLIASKEKDYLKDPLVPICAATALARLANDTNKFTIVDSMAEALEFYHENDRIRYYISQACARISGEKAFTDHRFWRLWAQTKGSLEEESRKGHTDEAKPKPKFFGTEAVGNRLVFVIDRSGSMGAPAKMPPAPKKEEPPEEKDENITGKGSKSDKEKKEEEANKEPPPPDYSKVKIKLDLAKVELCHTLTYLPEDYEFNVVIYSTNHDYLINSIKGYVKATEANKKKFIAEIQKLTAEGATNIHGAVTRAFCVTAKGQVDKKSDPGLDPEVFRSGAETIFFLTDGFATHSDYGLGSSSGRGSSPAPDGADPFGQGQNENMIMDFSRINTFRKSIINTVGIGPHDQGLLRAMADMSGGVYKDLTGAAGN